MGGALHKYSFLYLIFIRIFYSSHNECTKILQASGSTKPESVLGVNEIVVTLRQGFS